MWVISLPGIIFVYFSIRKQYHNGAVDGEEHALNMLILFCLIIVGLPVCLHCDVLSQ